MVSIGLGWLHVPNQPKPDCQAHGLVREEHAEERGAMRAEVLG